MTPGSVLVTRLLPPRLPPACLQREQLERRLTEGFSGRLVAVIAGPGYGKSTLVARALEQTGAPAVWCSCDGRIADATLLLAHIAAGIGRRFESFDGDLRLSGPLDEQVTEICNAVSELVPDEFVLVLDDFQTLGGSAIEAIGLLVQDLPPSVHPVLVGRSPPPLPLGRLRAAGALELGETDLALSESETGALLRSLSIGAQPSVVAELHARTEGWISGLILASRLGAGIADVDQGTAAQFEYLAEEVFSRLPEDRCEFLLATSLLDRFSPDLAAAVTDIADAREMARGLVADHLFTSRLEGEGEWYRYHHLLQSFLRRRLGETAPERVPELHRRAARWWLEGDKPTEAVPHLLSAGELALAVDVLDRVADTLVGTPEAETLSGWLDSIPRELWCDRPSLLGAHASLLLTRAQHESSFPAFEAAIGALIAIGDHDRAAVACVRLQQSMVTAGTRPAQRIEAGRRQIDRIEPGARMLPAAQILLATSYAYACRFTEAQDLLAAAVASCGTSPVIRAYAEMARAFYILYPRGGAQDALTALESAIAALEGQQDDDELAFLPYARIYRGYLLNDLGRHEAALAELATTAHASTRRGIGRAVGRALVCIRLTALAGLERWSELEAELSRGDDDLRLAEASSYGYRFRDPAARLAAHDGDAAAVRGHIAAARAHMGAVGVVFDTPMFLCNFARAAWDAGLTALASNLAEEARGIAMAIHTPAWQARAALLGALATGPDPAGDRLLSEALDLTGVWCLDEMWSGRERAVARGLLSRAQREGLGPGGLAARLAGVCGAEAPDGASTPGARPRIAVADRARPALRIRTLGGLSISRGGVPLSNDAFGRPKARELLGALLSTGRGVHRDLLIEWLWPRLSLDRGPAALRTTLHQLRRALEPELAPRQRSSLIPADGGTLRLVLAEGDELDVSVFMDLARPYSGGVAATISRLEAAEIAYRGPFLPEWPYEEWAQIRRDDLEATYRDVLARLSLALVGAGRANAAMPRYQRLSALEPEREGWHRALMECFATMGERALALRQYHACRSVLRRELGVEPGPETRALYERLLRDDGQGRRRGVDRTVTASG